MLCVLKYHPQGAIHEYATVNELLNTAHKYALTLLSQLQVSNLKKLDTNIPWDINGFP